MKITCSLVPYQPNAVETAVALISHRLRGGVRGFGTVRAHAACIEKARIACGK